MEENKFSFVKFLKSKVPSLILLLFFWILVFVSTNPLVKNADSLNPDMKPIMWLILVLGSFLFVFFLRDADEFMFLMYGVVFGCLFVFLNNQNADVPDLIRSILVTIAYLALGFLAVRRAICYKSVFFLMFCFPLTIYEASIGTQIALLVGGCFLFSSVCWRYHFSKEEKMKVVDVLLLLVSSVLIICSKNLIFTPVLLQIFLIRKSAFSKKGYFWILFFGELMLISVIYLIHMEMPDAWIFMPEKVSEEVILGNYVRFMKDPLEILSMLLHDGSNQIILNFSRLHMSAALGETGYFIWWCIALGMMGCQDRYQYDMESKEDRKIRRSFLGIMVLVLAGLSLTLIWNRYLIMTDFAVGNATRIEGTLTIPIIGLFTGLVSQIPVENSFKNYGKKLSLGMTLAILNTAGYLLLHYF